MRGMTDYQVRAAAVSLETNTRQTASEGEGGREMIRKLKSGEFRIYSRHQDPKTGRRKNLGTFATREKAQEHEKAIQYFKRH
jgi:lauroyl/myristoyl acyltransferase